MVDTAALVKAAAAQHRRKANTWHLGDIRWSSEGKRDVWAEKPMRWRHYKLIAASAFCLSTSLRQDSLPASACVCVKLWTSHLAFGGTPNRRCVWLQCRANLHTLQLLRRLHKDTLILQNTFYPGYIQWISPAKLFLITAAITIRILGFKSIRQASPFSLTVAKSGERDRESPCILTLFYEWLFMPIFELMNDFVIGTL